MHIDNLYKQAEILNFKRCYALEKIHGTSAHISYKDGQVRFFSGGENHNRFVAVMCNTIVENSEEFDTEECIRKIEEAFASNGLNDIVIYGEAYGGKQQGMSKTYGPNLKFIAFDVKIDDKWLAVPLAEAIVKAIGLEFVDYVEIETSIEAINAERDKPSTQAIRNGMGEQIREGVVLRPLTEYTKNNGNRVIVKHKRDEFKETKTPREVSPEQLAVLSEAGQVADEWVTPMRLAHVLDKLPEATTMKAVPDVIRAMQEDVEREGEGEIVWSKEVRSAVSNKTVGLYKAYLQKELECKSMS